jgi:hypothetical protein
MNEGTRFGTTMHSPKVVQDSDAYPIDHGLRPVICLLRVMPVKVNSPVRLLVASLR